MSVWAQVTFIRYTQGKISFIITSHFQKFPVLPVPWWHFGSTRMVVPMAPGFWGCLEEASLYTHLAAQKNPFCEGLGFPSVKSSESVNQRGGCESPLLQFRSISAPRSRIVLFIKVKLKHHRLYIYFIPKGPQVNQLPQQIPAVKNTLIT